MTENLDVRFAPILSRMLKTLDQKVSPKNAALLVIDVQNDYCADGGYLSKEGFDMKPVQATAGRIVKLIGKARTAKVPIIYIRTIYVSNNEWYLSDSWLEQHRRVGRGKYVKYTVLEENTWGTEFYTGIKPLPGEVIITKHRFDPFVGTELELVLKSKGIRSIIVTGVTTDCCVESAVRSGFNRDYYMVVVSDCTNDLSQEKHTHALKTMDYFGQIVESADIIKCWQNLE